MIYLLILSLIGYGINREVLRITIKSHGLIAWAFCNVFNVIFGFFIIGMYFAFNCVYGGVLYVLLNVLVGGYFNQKGCSETI